MGVGRPVSGERVVAGAWFSGVGGLGSVSLPSPAKGASPWAEPSFGSARGSLCQAHARALSR